MRTCCRKGYATRSEGYKFNKIISHATVLFRNKPRDNINRNIFWQIFSCIIRHEIKKIGQFSTSSHKMLIINCTTFRKLLAYKNN